MIGDRWGVTDAEVQQIRVVAVEPGRSLTGDIGGTAMSYVLLPVDDARTRLLITVVSALPRVLAPVLSVGDVVMARRRLRTFAALAEGRA